MRRLPSRGAGAWRYAPLLPWRVQCPGRVCAALAAGSGGVQAGAGSCVFPVSPCPPRVSCVVCGGPSCLGVPYPCSLVRHSMRSVHSAGSVRLPFLFSPRVLCVCVRSRSRGVRAPPPLPGLVWCAHLARSRCWAPVGPFHSVRAPLRVLPRSCAPFGLLAGGRPGPACPYLASGCRLPVGWMRAWGPVTNPTARAPASWPCALAWRAVEATRGRPGGAPLAWVREFRGWALSNIRPLVLSGVRPGPTTHWLWEGGVRAWGPVTNPTARALASWLCALWGRHENARGGGRLLPGCGPSGVGRSPTPNHSSFRACGRGPLPTGCGCGGCGRGDPSLTPQRALLRAGFARCGGGMRVPGWGRLLPGEGASWVGRSPTPDHLSFQACGRGPLLSGCGCGGSGCGDPSPTPQHALLRAGFARCAGGMRVLGEGASCLGVGHPGSGALPAPTSRPFMRAAGAHYPLAVGAGDAGVGNRHQPHSARSCELALRAVGAA